MSPEDTATESCKCNGVCSRKDGSKAKGCPCKRVAYYAPKDANALRPAKIARIR